jgi:hypothetical protein
MRGKRRGTAKRRRLALFATDSSLDFGGGEKLRREIAPRPVDDVEDKQREMREERLGYL